MGVGYLAVFGDMVFVELGPVVSARVAQEREGLAQDGPAQAPRGQVALRTPPRQEPSQHHHHGHRRGYGPRSAIASSRHSPPHTDTGSQCSTGEQQAAKTDTRESTSACSGSSRHTTRLTHHARLRLAVSFPGDGCSVRVYVCASSCACRAQRLRPRRAMCMSATNNATR
jgi:hypothetical protein